MSDYERWISRAQNESADRRERQQAFTQVVRRFQDMAYGYALGRLGDRQSAEDAAQEAFITAWRSLGTLRDPAAFPGWLKAIVATRCARIERQRPVGEMSAEVRITDPIDPVSLLTRREQQQEVRNAIAGLPEHERICITLFYIGENSYQEMASYLDVPLSTVKKRLYSARKRLRERMTEMIKDTLQEDRPSGSEDFVRSVEFYAAVKSGDTEMVTQLLDQQPALLQTTSTARLGYGLETPLRQAIIDAGLPMVELILTRGALVSEADVEAAAQIGKRDIARLLIEAGGIDSAIDKTDASRIAWFRAAHAGDTSKSQTLSENDPDLINSRDKTGRTALMIASAYGDLEMVRVLISRGADVQTPDAQGQTAFRHAATHVNWCNAGQPEVMELLAASGATYDIFTAAGAGVLSLVQKMVAADPALVDARNENGEGPLDCAVAGFSGGASAVIECLTARNPTMNIWMAAQFGDIDRVRTLLAADPSLASRARPRDGFRPLDCAARNWRAQEMIVPVIDLLVASGADVNARPNGTGWTPLHACAEWWNDTEIASALLRHGADINARSEEGWTPLQYALALGRTEMAEFLRTHGGTE